VRKSQLNVLCLADLISAHLSNLGVIRIGPTFVPNLFTRANGGDVIFDEVLRFVQSVSVYLTPRDSTGAIFR
jgi:hypothetical protein